jgi:hypothetical protein
MFWRFGGYANISTLDSILEKPDVTPEEVLEESDLIQELKQHNTKLLEFLRDEKVLKKLLEHVIAHKPAPLPPKKDGVEGDEQSEGYRVAEAERDKDEKARLKYAHVSCEVLSSETWSLLGALMANIGLLRGFWSFLDREPPLDPLQASYFTKVNETLLDKKTEEMMAFVRGLHGIVPKILRHVDCPMIMDLLLKIISMEKCEGGAGIVDVGCYCFSGGKYNRLIFVRTVVALTKSYPALAFLPVERTLGIHTNRQWRLHQSIDNYIRQCFAE